MMPSEFRIAGRVQKTPGVCGAEACIRRTRHTIAGLAQWRSLGLTDAQILIRHPDLTQQDLEAAWSYCKQNSAEIDRAIRDDEDARLPHEGT